MCTALGCTQCICLCLLTSLVQFMSVSVAFWEIMRLARFWVNSDKWDRLCELSDMMGNSLSVLKYTLHFLQSHIWVLDNVEFPSVHLCYGFLSTSFEGREIHKIPGYYGLSPTLFDFASFVGCSLPLPCKSCHQASSKDLSAPCGCSERLSRAELGMWCHIVHYLTLERPPSSRPWWGC